MTSKPTPWDEIRDPGSDYNVRLIEKSGPIPLYWGKDAAGYCLFIIELQGDHTEQFNADSTTVHGIQVDLCLLDSNRCQGLVLKLEKHVDRDLFYGMCQSLVMSLKSANDSSEAVAITLTHIKRWKAFMAGKRARLLSPEELRGLFAELSFLRLLYKEFLNEYDSVKAWCGADGVHQDFIFGNTAVEVKSITGRERSRIKISSEDQLETLCDNLFLTVFRLSENNDSQKSLSLNDLIYTIENEISDHSALEVLSSQIAAYGYVKLREYEQPKYIIAGPYSYEINPGFPRIIRSELPEGITKVGYEIDLENILNYKCDLKKIWS